MQAAARQRFIHPHIYDWPAPGADAADAGLPFLNWSADYADKVVARLRTEFGEWRDKFGDRLRCCLNTRITEVMHSSEPGKVRLVNDEGMVDRSFDLVLLGTGFGLEQAAFPGVPAPSYWGSDNLDGPFASKQRILVSGSGDGGLVDLARAAVRSDKNENLFRHDQAIGLLMSDPHFLELADAMARIDDEVRQARWHDQTPVNLLERYRTIPVDATLLARLRELQRSDTEVFFNFKDKAFNLNSALVNRLLVFLLLQAGVVKSRFGEITRVTPLPGQGAQVTFGGKSTEAYDQIILRHGPPQGAFFAQFPELQSACSELGGKVAEMELTKNLAPETLAWYRHFMAS
jgi:hypothetical protein